MDRPLLAALLAAAAFGATAEAAAAPVVTRVEGDVRVTTGSASIAVGRDGLALIAYGDVAPDDLRLARCLNRRCTRVRKRVAVRRGDAGGTTATAVRADGRPLVAFRDELWVSYLDCADRACTRGRVRTPQRDGGREFGGQFDLLLDGSRRPFLLSSQESGADDDERLYLGRCRDRGCARIGRTHGPATDANEHKGAAVDARGRLAVVHQFSDFDRDRNAPPVVELVLCRDAACTRRRTIEVARNATSPDVVLAGGLLTVVYEDPVGRDLEMARCVDVECTAFERRTLDAQDKRGITPSIVVDSEGRPAIVHAGAGAGEDLLLTRCADAACTAATSESVDGRRDADDFSAIAAGRDGQILVTFRSPGDSSLYVASFGA